MHDGRWVISTIVSNIADTRYHRYLDEERHEENDGELGELQLREVPLPPEVGPHAGSQAGQKIVAVHDAVHEAVERPGNPGGAA